MRVERVEGGKAALENQIRLLKTPTPVVRPPQHVLGLVTAFRASMARQRGTLVTFEDKLLVLRVYTNFILWEDCNSHTEAVNLTATALQMCRDTVFSIVREYRERCTRWA